MTAFELVAVLALNRKQFDQGLKGAESDARNAGGRIGKALGGIAKATGVALAAAGTAVAGATKAFVSQSQEVAEYGDHIDKMSQKIGISAEAYQEWDAIMQHCGASIDSMRPAMKTLATQAQKNSEEFKKLGISEQEVASLSTEELFAKTIEGLQGMEEGTERTYIASKLLGRGATELGALLNTSAEDTEKMRQKVHELGGVMSDEAVKASARFQDSLQDLKTGFSGLKRNLMAEFLPGISDVMDGLSDIITGKSDQGLETISKGIDNVITKFNEKLPKVIEIGGKIFSAIVKGIADNLPKLIDGLAGTITTLLPEIIDAISKAMPVLIQALVKLVTGIIEHLPEIIQPIIDAIPLIIEAILTIIPALIKALSQAVPQIIDGILGVFPEIITAIIEAIPDIVVAIIEYLPQMIAELVKAIIKNLPAIIAAVVEGLVLILVEVAKFFGELFGMEEDGFNDAENGIKDFFSNIGENIANFFESVINGISEFFTNTWNSITTGLQNLWDNITGWFSGLWDTITGFINEAWEWGKNLVEGLWQGIADTATEFWNNLTGWLSDVWEGIKDFFGIHSPSTKGAWLMEMFTKGMGNGLDKFGSDVLDKANELNGKINSTFSGKKRLNLAADFGELSDVQTGILTHKNAENSGWNGTGEEIIIPRKETQETRTQTVILQLDRHELARAIYTLGREEEQRVGIKLVGAY